MAFPIILTFIFLTIRKPEFPFFDSLDYISSMTAIPGLIITCAALYKISEVKEKVKTEIDFEELVSKSELAAKRYFFKEYQTNFEHKSKELIRDIKKFFSSEEIGVQENAKKVVNSCHECSYLLGHYKYISIKLEEIEQQQQDPKLANINNAHIYSLTKFNNLILNLRSISISSIVSGHNNDANLEKLTKLSTDLTELISFCEENIKEIKTQLEEYTLPTENDFQSVSGNTASNAGVDDVETL